jgi:hypothetical protein
MEVDKFIEWVTRFSGEPTARRCRTEIELMVAANNTELHRPLELMRRLHDSQFASQIGDATHIAGSFFDSGIED